MTGIRVGIAGRKRAEELTPDEAVAEFERVNKIRVGEICASENLSLADVIAHVRKHADPRPRVSPTTGRPETRATFNARVRELAKLRLAKLEWLLSAVVNVWGGCESPDRRPGRPVEQRAREGVLEAVACHYCHFAICRSIARKLREKGKLPDGPIAAEKAIDAVFWPLMQDLGYYVTDALNEMVEGYPRVVRPLGIGALDHGEFTFPTAFQFLCSMARNVRIGGKPLGWRNFAVLAMASDAYPDDRSSRTGRYDRKTIENRVKAALRRERAKRGTFTRTRRPR